jgi:hypothetical protein
MAESNSAAGFAHVSSIEAVTEIPADPLNSFFDKEAGYIGSEQRNQLFTRCALC